MKKLIDLKNLELKIEKYAFDHFEGNFSMAVRNLISRGLQSDDRVPLNLNNQKLKDSE